MYPVIQGAQQQNTGGKKLYDRIGQHDSKPDHIKCYMEWQNLEKRLGKLNTIEHQLDEDMQQRVKYWRHILSVILDVTLFLSERGLAFRGDNKELGSLHNGNFLGILELISHYDH